MSSSREWPLIIVGSGPAGINVALEAKRRGVGALLIDRGSLCNTLYHFPERMTFFSTAELLEFAGIPLVAAGAKPTKREVLDYFTRIVLSYELPFETFCDVQDIARADSGFKLITNRGDYHSHAVVLATGSYDQAKLLNVPGEDLAARFALLWRRSSLYRETCCHRGREKFGSRSRARTASRRRERNDCASRSRAFTINKILDQARS